MLKIIGRIAASAAVLVLSACGGGGGDDADAAAGAASLTSKADALRELGVATVIADYPLGIGVDVGGGFDPKAGSVAGGGRRGNRAPSPAKATGCQGGGQTDVVSGSSAHTFVFFDNQVAAAAFDRRTDTQCIEAEQDGATTYLRTYNGLVEEGNTDTLADGSALGYEREGSGDLPYTRQYEERRDGVTVYRETVQLRGEFEERRHVSARIFELRTIFQYQFSNSRGDAVVAILGLGNTPFKVTEGDGSLSFDGTYAYRSSENGCGGGTATIATLAPLTFSEGMVNGGRVRFVSGDKTASFTFTNDGGAVLELNGATLPPISAAEVDQALSSGPCAPTL